MLDEVDAGTPDGFVGACAEALVDAIGEVGRETARKAAGADALEAIEAGDADAVDLRDAAAILALRDGRDADAIVAEARDDLLLGMTSAVLDVEALTASLETDLDPKEVQAKVEGRLPLSLSEYARLRFAIESAT